MRSFAGVGDRFLKEMTTLEGTTIRGTIMPASDREAPAGVMSAPRVVLRTRRESEVTAGTIFRSPGGPLYLVGSYFAADNDYCSWRIFLLEKQYEWTRKKAKKDDLTGLERTNGAEPMGMIWAAVEHERRLFTDPGLKLKTERVLVVTNSPVKAGDLLDGQLITRVTEDLGLYVAEHA